jgi:hypothetical protein
MEREGGGEEVSSVWVAFSGRGGFPLTRDGRDQIERRRRCGASLVWDANPTLCHVSNVQRQVCALPSLLLPQAQSSLFGYTEHRTRFWHQSSLHDPTILHSLSLGAPARLGMDLTFVVVPTASTKSEKVSLDCRHRILFSVLHIMCGC